MDKFICRGKEPIDEYFNGGDWVVGYYACFNDNEHRIYSGYAETDCGDYYPDWYNVVPETVGRYTGLTDKNNNHIFEADILRKGFECFVVKWNSNQCRWGLFDKHDFEVSGFNEHTKNYLEIVGNIYDNPKLLNN